MPDYHLVGWANTLLPGSGQVMLGNHGTGFAQFGYEVGTFALGTSWSNGAVFSLDGFTSPRPDVRIGRAKKISAEQNLAGDILQEFGIKSYMANAYDAYRAAAFQSGEHPEIDHTSTSDLFLAPLASKNLSDPWVYIPIAIVLSTSIIDYVSQVSGSLPSTNRLTPSSNALYAFNYGIWQPTGSGAPEEMFYRGFLQNEFKTFTGSPLAAIAMSSIAFAFSHAPGNGRYSAGAVGAYLGYLTDRNNGQLSKGITIHFWSGVILGIEKILLSNKEQRTTPPATMSMQIEF